MKLPMHLTELLIRDMCVDLCRGDILMSEKLLDRAKVGTITK